MERTDQMTRQIKFSKARDSIIRKADQLATLCDVDVGLLMFSPNGRLTTFASNGRIEDIYLRYFNHLGVLQGGSSEEVEVLCQNLEHVKHENEMIEKMAKIEDLEKKLWGLKQRHAQVDMRMRVYNSNVDDITSVQQAEEHRRFIIGALQNIRQRKAAATEVDSLSMLLQNGEPSIAERNAGNGGAGSSRAV